MTLLPFAAFAALLLSIALMLAPCGKRVLSGEKQPTLAWLTALTGAFMTAGVPFFALEALSCALAENPSALPQMRFGPFPWAFAALAAGAVCLSGAKRPLWLRALAVVSAAGALVAALCFLAPTASEAFAQTPAFSGAKLPAWLAAALCLAAFAALMFVRGRKQFINFALWPALALVMIFLTGSGLLPLLRSLLATVRSFFSGAFAPDAADGASSGTLAFFAYWLCWSPVLALHAKRASSGRSVRQTVLGVYAAGLGAYALLCAVFGGFGTRLLDSLAAAGETTLALGSGGAQTMAKLMLSLPFGSMCAALLLLSALLTGVSALGTAAEGAAETLLPPGNGRRSAALCFGGVCGAAVIGALYFGASSLGWNVVGYAALPAAAWLLGECVLSTRSLRK